MCCPSSMERKANGINSNKYIRYPDEVCANDFVNPEADALYRDSIEN